MQPSSLAPPWCHAESESFRSTAAGGSVQCCVGLPFHCQVAFQPTFQPKSSFSVQILEKVSVVLRSDVAQVLQREWMLAPNKCMTKEKYYKY